MPVSFSGTSGLPHTMESKVVFNNGSTVSSVYVCVTFIGTIRFFVCADGDSESWEEISSLSSGVQVTHAFSTTGTEIRWKALLSVGASVSRIVIQKAS